MHPLINVSNSTWHLRESFSVDQLQIVFSTTNSVKCKIYDYIYKKISSLPIFENAAEVCVCHENQMSKESDVFVAQEPVNP